ncbi:MAG TPA: hypothetical protein VMU65_08045 [Candidatus Saccharimonadales bacterium]|nr:hypothetical protein [Candidatus Saccharimonadales bacterium]
MPAVVVARPDDEIADLIDRVRSAGDLDVGLVVPSSSRALQTPLNVRLLAQFSNQSGRRTAIVSEDPRVQQLSRASGLQVYGSVPAFERGIELAAPRAGGAGLARNIATAGGAGAAASAVLEPPPTPPPAPPSFAAPPTAPVTPRLEPRRVLTQIPPAHPKRGWDRRRLLSWGGAAVLVIGLLLFMTLSPSAKVTVTIAATPLSVNSTIQGTTNAALSSTADHVLTRVVTGTASSTFQASPTGTLPIAAGAATTKVSFSTDYPNGYSFLLPQGNEIKSSDGSTTFAVTKATFICIGPNGSPAPAGSCGSGVQPNALATVQDSTPGSAGNSVGAGTLTNWPSDPCPSPAPPPPQRNLSCVDSQGHYHSINVTNPSAPTGGVDAKTTTSASATDVSNWTQQVTAVEASLTSQLNQSLQALAGGKAFAVDPSGNGKTVVFAVTPPLPAVNAPFTAATITVSANGEAVVYDPVAVRNDVIADLNKLVRPGNQLAPGKLATPPCTVTQASTTGTVVLACSATDFSQPAVDLNALKTELTGRNPGSAQKIIEDKLPEVQSVHVSMSPFQLFYMPLFASRIEITENFVAPTAPTPSPTASPKPSLKPSP